MRINGIFCDLFVTSKGTTFLKIRIKTFTQQLKPCGVQGMAETFISHLRSFGLNVNEAKVYEFLLRADTARASEIAKSSRIPRNKVYEIAESLSKKGFIEILPEKVTKFKAIQLDAAIKFQIENFQSRIKQMEETKDEMNRYIESAMKKTSVDEGAGYFAVYRSKNLIKKKVVEMLSLARKKVCLMVNSSDLRRFINNAKAVSGKIEVEVLSPVINENKFLAESWMKFAKLRHYRTESQIKIFISDNDEILLFKLDNPVALYSKDRQFVSLFRTFFDSAWNSSIDAKERIKEIETGKPAEEIRYIKGRENFYAMIPDIMRNTKKEIILATKANGIVRIYKYLMDAFDEAAARGVKIRILMPINRKNIVIARKMDFAEIRHVDDIPSVISCHDDSFMVMMQVKDDSVKVDSPEDVIMLTNQKSTVQAIKNMLEYMWASAIDSAARIRELETGQPVERSVVIRGEEAIFEAITNSVKETEKDLIVCASNYGMRMALERRREILEDLNQKGVKIRYLTSINSDNIESVKKLLELADVRHSIIPPSFVITDTECLITSLEGGVPGELIKTNSPSLVERMKEMLESIWESSVPAARMFEEIEKGGPVEQTSVIRGIKGIYDSVIAVSRTAKKEICNISSEFSLERGMKYGTTDTDRKMAAKGVKVRYIFPVTKNNVHLVKKAMEFAEVRHIDFVPIKTRIIDGEKCLVRYGSEATILKGDQMNISSSMPDYVATMKSYFEGVWENAVPAEEAIKRLEQNVLPEQMRQKKADLNYSETRK